MGITSKQLAEICGVSRGTVDRALNNKGRIDPNTKQRILDAAREQGYRPDPIARSLVKGKTRNIGVIAFDLQNRYFAQLLNAIEAKARYAGYFINFTLQENDPNLEIHQINDLVDRRVAGLLLCPVNKGAKFGKFLTSLGIPVLTIGNYVSSEVPFIGMNESGAASSAVRYIIDRGYEHIIFYCPPLKNCDTKNTYVHEQRVEGFTRELADSPSISSEIITDSKDYAWLEKLLDQLDEDTMKKTACFCSGDIFALDMMKYIHQNHGAIHKKFGLMGFDGIDTIDYVTPTLTTIHNPVEEIGRKAVDLMVACLESETSLRSETLIPYHIMPGETI
ncbi:LacI family DNA-binding transcriptional regulator [Oceanispirochaeta sp.]|jgi:LacI family transcriptional regulator|uniref:LacI family DNA-binding transcriptional regulator n=1 Tax=Oceanispirochaeta sp. TaxID=2035350 RepID=UPI002635E9DA|nr:LacI family DNA-binding transcriptional regulator [Oceanispirochaeta sp.]MDA3957106.1 LacI family DNA-binding transcriptional regulator [Oceanispirochaeta sp.]